MNDGRRDPFPLGVRTDFPPALGEGEPGKFVIGANGGILVEGTGTITGYPSGLLAPVTPVQLAATLNTLPLGRFVVASDTIAIGARTLHQFFGFHTTGNDFLLFFDALAVPANGAVPVFSARPVANNMPFDFSLLVPWSFAVGIVWANSTTRTSLTLGGADVWLSALYE